MVIANPIYDVVFKRLMEDKRIAKFFIETLMEEPVEKVWLKPQEFTHPEEVKGLGTFRLDFIATIKTESGEFKNVLIEIQKARNSLDLMRFRNYLGEQYKKEEEIKTEKGNVITPLPIVTIYLLGFTLPGVETPAVKVAREYIDLITHKVIPRKTDFIEKLTHDCFVVQLLRIKGKWHTKIEELLSVFEQNYFIDDKKIIKEYKYDITNKNMKRIVDVLNYEGTDPLRKKEIETEQEYWRTFYAEAGEGFRENLEKIEKQEKIIEENKITIEENKITIEKKDIAIEAERKAKEAERKAKEEIQKALEETEKERERDRKEIEELKRKLGNI